MMKYFSRTNNLACALPLVLLAMNVALAQTAARSAVTPRIELSPCDVDGTEPNSKVHVQCGTLAVYENRATRKGHKIALKIEVFPAAGTRLSDPLFYIPGGPGSAATDDAPYMARPCENS